MIFICNNQVTNHQAQEYLFQRLPFPILPFPILQTWRTWVKSLDIDDLNSGAQSLNPILTLAMVELHASSSQFAQHAKSLKNTGASWCFCLSMMFNYFFTNSNWIFENVFLTLFVHKVVFNYFSWWAIEFFSHEVLLKFLFTKCSWYFSHDMLFNFFSCLLGEYWSLKFLSSKFGLCLL